MMRAVGLLFALLALAVQPSPRRQLVVVHGDDVDPAALEGVIRWRTPVWVRAAEATEERLRGGPVAFVGTGRSNPWLRKLEVPGLTVHEHGFTWNGTRYDDPSDVLQLRARSAFDDDYSMEIAVGAPIAQPLRRRRADVHIRRDGRTLLLGFRRDDGGYDTRVFDPEGTLLHEDEHLRVVAHGIRPSPEALGTFVRSVGSLPRRVDVHLYPSLEVKGLVTDDTRAAHRDGDVFHAVLGFDRSPARLLVESSLETASLFERRGRAAIATLDDESLDALDERARRLLLTSDPPDVLALSDDEVFLETSPFVTEAVSASFARFAQGRDGSPASQVGPWARALTARPPKGAASPAASTGFQRGFTFAHEGYQIHNGYLSARSGASLDRLGALGIDAVAVVPYTFMTDPSVVSALDVPRRAGSETDEDVILAVRRAKRRGMHVLLKPQIWIRRAWPGDVHFASEDDTEQFFESYRRWILHYALLAEEEEVPLLAIGTELARLTAAHEPAWRRIIEDVRCVYRGELVYAANWGDEVENVVFWPLLDYIGVDFYYPLSFEEHASDEALAAGFRDALGRVEAVHEKYDKPVLLTEIGYASTRAPWRKPHASHEEPAVSPADQARAYDVAFGVLAGETDWVRGMYWWKWPTDLRRGGDGHRGFTPNGKTAEDVVRRWYRSAFD